MNQWIFLVDGYGQYRELDNDVQRQHAAKKPTDPEYQIVDRSDAIPNSAGIFQPYILRFMNNNTISFYNQRQEESQQTVDDYLRSQMWMVEQRGSSMHIDRANYNEDQVLDAYVLGLQTELNRVNIQRMDIDK